VRAFLIEEQKVVKQVLKAQAKTRKAAEAAAEYVPKEGAKKASK
jgi:hypothetical protein